MKAYQKLILITSLLLLQACKDSTQQVTSPPTAPNIEVSLLEDGEKYPGGKLNTIVDVSPNAFSFPSPALKDMEKLQFFVGNSFFKLAWVASPASTRARDGLGPTFNARSCAACHLKDGRGTPVFAGEMTNGLLLRLSVPNPHGGAPIPVPNYGGQLNDQAVGKVPYEGKIKVTYEDIHGQYADGTKYTLRKPIYAIDDPQYGDIPKDIMISPRVGQQIIGMGLLEAIKDEDLLALADPEDKNQDGISGKVNMVWDKINKKEAIGRFGWKSNEPSVKQQTAGAFLGDLGITTSLNPDENITPVQKEAAAAPNGGQPEIDDDDLDKTSLYVANLSVPARRQPTDPDILAGKKLFNKLNCSSCHTPSFTTGKHHTFDNLSHQKIFPYTDLLVHDMGEDLADNRPDHQANGREWRTQPLWGIGLIKTVNGHSFLLHDGRARNVEEAILWHGGEAEESREAFKKLSEKERDQLIKFINDL